MAFLVAPCGLDYYYAYRVIGHAPRLRITIGEPFALHGSLNPFLCDKPLPCAQFGHFTPSVEHQASNSFQIPLSDLAVEALRAAKNDPDQRMEMLISQPPISSATLICSAERSGLHRFYVHAKYGLRLRDIAAVLQPHIFGDSTLRLCFAIPSIGYTPCPIVFPSPEESCLRRLYGPMSATDRMFAIDELLEKVLQNLPPKRAKLAQQVCRRWQEVISTSPGILRSVFMKEDLARAAYRLDIRRFEAPNGFSPCVQSYSGVWFKVAARATTSQISEYPREEIIWEGRFNPYVCFPCRERCDIEDHMDHRATCNPHTDRFNIRLDVLKACAGSNAKDGRLNMFLTQPPYDVVSVSVRLTAATGSRQIDVARIGGVRLRDIIEKVETRVWKISDTVIGEIYVELNSKHTEGGHNMIYLSESERAVIQLREANAAFNKAKAEQEAAMVLVRDALASEKRQRPPYVERWYGILG